MYKTNKESEKRRDLSIGEDLETLIGKIKNGEINSDTILKNGDYKSSFLLCLLDKEERKKLEEKDDAFMYTFTWDELADVPEAEWKASESNLKFARYECYRHTYFIDCLSSQSQWYFWKKLTATGKNLQHALAVR